MRKWESRISETTSESDRLAWRASRLAITSVSLLSVKLTRLGLRKDLGLPIGIIAHFMRKNSVASSAENRRASLCASRLRHRYLNFNVVRARRANTSAAIQKRTIIFDSFHPANSK